MFAGIAGGMSSSSSYSGGLQNLLLMITSASVSEVGLDDVLVGVMFASWALPIWSASSCRKLGAVLHSCVLRSR